MHDFGWQKYLLFGGCQNHLIDLIDELICDASGLATSQFPHPLGQPFFAVNSRNIFRPTK